MLLDSITNQMFDDGGMDFGGDEEEKEVKGFSGGGMRMTAKVSIDHNSGQVTGWDTIWALIQDENERKIISEDKQEALKNRLEDGVKKYVKNTKSIPNDNLCDANLWDFSDFEVAPKSDTQLVMTSVSDPSRTIDITLKPRDDGRPGVEWDGLPESLMFHMNVFTAQE